MKKIGLLLAIGGMVFITSCRKLDASKGTPVENTVSLTGFTGIGLSMAGNLTFTEGETTSIIVKAPQKVYDKMDIDIKNNVLDFDLKKGYYLKNADAIEITVVAPDINRISLSGSGDVTATFDALISRSEVDLSISGSGSLAAKNITAGLLDMSISGSGNISSTNTLTTDAEASVSGSGNVTVDGSSVNNDIKISGSGSFKGYDFITENTDVRISGSGDAEVTANAKLDVSISGSGDVRYKGTPTVNVSGSGSGSVSNSN